MKISYWITYQLIQELYNMLEFGELENLTDDEKIIAESIIDYCKLIASRAEHYSEFLNQPKTN